MEDCRAVRKIAQGQLDAPQLGVAGDHIDAGHGTVLDERGQVDAVAQEGVGEAAGARRLHVEGHGERRLRVEVDDEHGEIAVGQGPGDVEARRRFAATALLIDQRDHMEAPCHSTHSLAIAVKLCFQLW